MSSLWQTVSENVVFVLEFLTLIVVMFLIAYVIEKAVKKKNVTREEAIRLLSHVLDCANTLLYEDDTTQLEKSLASTKEPELLIKIFKQIKLVKA